MLVYTYINEINILWLIPDWKNPFWKKIKAIPFTKLNFLLCSWNDPFYLFNGSVKDKFISWTQEKKYIYIAQGCIRFNLLSIKDIC